MKLEIPIIVGFDDLESLLDDLKKLQTYKLSEGAEEILVDIEDVAEVLMKHVKAKKSVKGDDLISREAALDMVEESMRNNPHKDTVHRAMHDHEHRHFLLMLMRMPSAQPKTGKWIYIDDGYMDYFQCDKCKLRASVKTDYCPNCGCRMLMEGDNID